MKIQAVSRMGSYHTETKGHNEDAVCSGQNRRLCVLSLADGVTDCREAKAGAELACRAVTDLLLTKGNVFLELDDDSAAEILFSHIFHELRKIAERDGRPVEDYSSTVTSVLIEKGSGRMLCYHHGDSLVLAVGNGRCRVLALPSLRADGCVVTTTRNGHRGAGVSRFDIRAFDSVAVVSDGAWRSMITGNRFRPDVAALLARGDYGALETFLAAQNCRDDYSFIAADTRQTGRKCA